MKKLGQGEYERLCREVCEGYTSAIAEEALWFAICKKVYHYFYGYRQDLTFPYTEGPRTELYKSALQQMVTEGQSEPFDPLEVADKYVKLWST